MIKRISSNFVEWCVEVLDSDNYVILDTETTGLDKSDQILELAIIGTSCEVLYNELLRPSCPIC
jgi:DNA polymerase III epsilon subunit-like protein